MFYFLPTLIVSMSQLGSIQPSLIDPRILKQATQQAVIQASGPSPILVELEKLGSIVISFIRRNFLYVIGFFFIASYVYYCYKEHKKTKDKIVQDLLIQNQINNLKKRRKVKFTHNGPKEEPSLGLKQGDYVCDNNGARILQRPIPSFQSDDINAEIRKYQLSKVDVPGKKTFRPLDKETVYRCRRLPTYENKISNIYGQQIRPMAPISQCDSESMFDTETYGDTFYEESINNKFADDSDEFADQFYQMSDYQ